MTFLPTKYVRNYYYLKIVIDNNRDISLLLDMSSTMINDFEILKSENKVLAHQSNVQHSTIIELHNNSIKLSEMVEYLKLEINSSIDASKLGEERLNYYTQELKDKEDKIRLVEKKIEEISKLNYTLSEHKNILQNELLEKVFICYLIIFIEQRDC